MNDQYGTLNAAIQAFTTPTHTPGQYTKAGYRMMQNHAGLEARCDIAARPNRRHQLPSNTPTNWYRLYQRALTSHPFTRTRLKAN